MRKNQFPVTLGDGKPPVHRMVDQRQTFVTGVRILQDREETLAVFTGIGRQRDADQLRQRGQQIDLADRLVPAPARLTDPSRPANEKRYPVTALVDLPFAAAIDMAAAVIVLLDAQFPGIFRTVIAAEDDQRVVIQAGIRQERENAADMMIGLDHELAVRTALPCPMEYR